MLRNLHCSLLYSQLVKKTSTVGNQFYSYSSAYPLSFSSPSSRGMLLEQSASLGDWRLRVLLRCYE